MASPQPPIDYRYYRRHRQRSMAGPIVLIGIGVCLLLANMRIVNPAALAWVFATWWPVLLILLGLVRIIEYALARRDGGPAPRLGGGAIFLLVLFVMIGLSASGARRVNWQAFGDNIEVDPGWEGLWGQKYEFTQELSQPLPAEGRLQVDASHGSITVHVAENGDSPVKLVVHRHILADSQDAANKFNERQQPTMTMDGNTLRIGAGENQPQIHVGFSMGPRVTSDLEIWAPRKAAVQAQTAHGDVSISQRDADIKISTTHGDVQLNQIKGNVEVTSNHGDVHVNQITGDVHFDGRADDVTVGDVSGVVALEGQFYGDMKISHVSGSVKLHSSRTDMELAKLAGDLEMDSGGLRVTSVSGPFEVHTKAKDIRLEDISGSVIVENSHGEVDVRPHSPFGDVNVSNHQGAIHVVIPENSGFVVDARSTRGELESDFQLNVSEHGDDHAAAGTLGKGGNKLQLTTDHGTIEIRKG